MLTSSVTDPTSSAMTPREPGTRCGSATTSAPAPPAEPADPAERDLVAERLADLEAVIPALRTKIADLTRKVRALEAERDAAIARVEELEAQIEALDRDPTLAQMVRIGPGVWRSVEVMWQKRDEKAAMEGFPPTLRRDAHPDQAAWDFARTHAVQDVIGQALEVCGLPPLRRAGQPLVGRCPLCLRDGLHVHDYGAHNTWGCRACARFGSSYHFAGFYHQLHQDDEEGDDD
jgi:hypothetical protein